jgi:hypothetical protein
MRPSFRAILHTKLWTLLFYLFFLVSTLAIFIPLHPDMPARGLDTSWELAMDQAVAQHLSFGKDIMFTYGPYASIASRMYHPATDRRMMWGSLLLAVSYTTALLLLALGRKRYLVVVLLLFLATFGTSQILLFTYPFLFLACTLRKMEFDGPTPVSALRWWQVLALVVMLSAVGLLPLVKGSFLLPVGVSLAIPSVYLLYRARFGQAFSLISIPIAATAFFWVTAGQSLANLPAFLRGNSLLTSGYTEAMSVAMDVYLPKVVSYGSYLAASSLICLSIAVSAELKAAPKWMLGSACVVFLLVAFKLGFIRPDLSPEHQFLAFSSVAVFILIIGFLYVDRYLIVSLCIVVAFIAVGYIRLDPVLGREVEAKFGVGTAAGGKRRAEIVRFCSGRAIASFSRMTYNGLAKTYGGAWEGLRSRLSRSNTLQDQFARSLASIERERPLAQLAGTADIYSYEQSLFFASKDSWDPRPVFQSYSAYTPALARMNERHLRGPDAPDWVFFKLQSIDGRLPSLDDGLSWPALFDNYRFVSYDGQFALLRKGQLLHATSKYDEVDMQTCKTGVTVSLPNTNEPLFAKVELKPTLAGRVLIALFKPPELQIVLGLKDGNTRRYRVISEMMTTGFFVSPLVSNTGEFAALAAARPFSQDSGIVQSISIAPSYGGSLFWSDTYRLTLEKYHGEPEESLSTLSRTAKP